MASKPTEAELALALHKIVDAASALFTNVEHLARHVPAEDQQTVADCRESIELIARLAREVRAGIEGRPAVGQLTPASNRRAK